MTWTWLSQTGTIMHSQNFSREVGNSSPPVNRTPPSVPRHAALSSARVAATNPDAESRTPTYRESGPACTFSTLVSQSSCVSLLPGSEIARRPNANRASNAPSFMKPPGGFSCHSPKSHHSLLTSFASPAGSLPSAQKVSEQTGTQARDDLPYDGVVAGPLSGGPAGQGVSRAIMSPGLRNPAIGTSTARQGPMNLPGRTRRASREDTRKIRARTAIGTKWASLASPRLARAVSTALARTRHQRQ